MTEQQYRRAGKIKLEIERIKKLLPLLNSITCITLESEQDDSHYPVLLEFPEDSKIGKCANKLKSIVINGYKNKLIRLKKELESL